MTKINFHVHTNESRCGQIPAREVVNQAIKCGVTHMCFTDHFLLPKEIRDYGSEAPQHLDEYYDELVKLKEEFADDIDISIGLEVDWIEGYENWHRECLSKRDYDFLLGSVHYLKAPSGEFFNIRYFDRVVEEFGDVQKALEKYYSEMKKMIEFGLVDCISHMDVFKKQLGDRDILHENWLKEIIIEVLKLIKEKRECFEINASGIRVAGEQYPTKWIIEKAKEMGIPVTIGNDFHSLEHGEFDEGLDDAIKLVKDVGYKSVLIFKNRKPVEVKI